MYGVVAGITAFGGVSALAGAAAHADSSFTFTRIGGADRYATAGLFTAGAFPGGATSIYLADGLPGHQSDALAASGWGGVNNYGALLTDNTNSVPANTTSALSNNKVKNVVILGGTNAVSQAQQTALTGAGYTVTRIAGATRLDTMQALDDAIAPSSVGKDSAGNATAILASGDDAHLVDALSAGGTAYGMKFPVILTSSSSSTLPAQAQQVITALGIKHLVVVGGTAAVPASQYQPNPSGVNKVDVEAGADRSATSMVFSDFAIAQTPPWDKNSKMELARGDDGADALASAPYSGITDALSTCVTLSPNDPGSCPAFASEHKATLTGPSIIAGLQAAVTDSAAQTVAQAGGGNVSAGQVALLQNTAAPGGTVNGTVSSPGSIQSLTVSGCGLSSQSITFDPNSGNFTLTIPTSQTSGSCNLAFTATKTAAAGGGTQSTTVPFTVGSGGVTTVGCSQTSLPQLCSASILSTTAAPGTAQQPAGTVVQYVFNQNVSTAVLSSAGFKIWPANGTPATAGNAVACPGGANCARADSTNTNAIDVLFAGVTTTTAAQGFTLATVAGPQSAGGPAVITGAGQSPDGAAPLGNTGTGTLTQGQTAAPNLENATNTRLGGATFFGGNSVAIDLTWDKVAYATNTGGFSILYTGTTNPGPLACTGPVGGSNTPSGGVAPGGEGTTTFTIVCPEQVNGTVPSTSNIARIIVQPLTVETQPIATAPVCAAPGPNVAGTVTTFCNPWEVSDTPHNAALTPSLTGASIFSGTGANGGDQQVFSFDQPISPTTLNAANFFYYTSSGTQVNCTGGNGCAGAAVSTTNPTQVIVTWAAAPAHTLSSAVGGIATAGAATGANSGLQNQTDEMGSTNPTTTTTTSGVVQAPQLQAVKRVAVSVPAGTTFVFVYVFSQPVTPNGGGAFANFGSLHAYDPDGVELTCTAATVGSGANNNQVTCSSFNQVTAGGVATQAQLQNASLGTSDAGAATGTTAPFNNPSPEGAATVTS